MVTAKSAGRQRNLASKWSTGEMKIKMLPHAILMSPQLCQKFRGAEISQAACQFFEFRGIGGHFVERAIVYDAQPALDTKEKLIRCLQIGVLTLGHSAGHM